MISLTSKKTLTPKKLTFKPNFESDFGGFRGYEVTPETLYNVSFQRKNRTYDAIVDASGNADFNTIEAAVAYTESIGGGDIFIWGGTYTPSSTITITKPTNITGENIATTTINFNSTSRNFISNSGTLYTTGTITGITSGVNVTGSGTSWLTNVTVGQYLFLRRSVIIM